MVEIVGEDVVTSEQYFCILTEDAPSNDICILSVMFFASVGEKKKDDQDVTLAERRTRRVIDDLVLCEKQSIYVYISIQYTYIVFIRILSG